MRKSLAARNADVSSAPAEKKKPVLNPKPTRVDTTPQESAADARQETTTEAKLVTDAGPTPSANPSAKPWSPPVGYSPRKAAAAGQEPSRSQARSAESVSERKETRSQGQAGQAAQTSSSNTPPVDSVPSTPRGQDTAIAAERKATSRVSRGMQRVDEQVDVLRAEIDRLGQLCSAHVSELAEFQQLESTQQARVLKRQHVVASE